MSRTSALFALSLLISCTPEQGPPEDLDASRLVREAPPTSADVWMVLLEEDGLPPLPPMGTAPDDVRHALELRRRALAAQVDDLLADLGPRVEPVRRYEYLPVLAVALEGDVEADLRAHPLVHDLEPETLVETFDTESFEMIGQPMAEHYGFTGQGTSVVVIDTGADHTHADLGGCTDPGQGADCRVVYSADLAPEDGVPDDDGHGTNVAAIVAGVAPSTDLIVLDAFTGDTAHTTDVLAALDWVVANQSSYAIAAVNLSVGAGSYTSTCTDAYTSTIATVRSAGVSVVIAVGNDGHTDAVASPACNADALSVGAVYDAHSYDLPTYEVCADTWVWPNLVPCFSNSAASVDIFAPGATIDAGGYSMAGTSQAAAHVAGAVAVLRDAWPEATLDELEQLLRDSGNVMSDHRNGLQRPRLNLDAALYLIPDPDSDDEDCPTCCEPPAPPVTDASIVIEDGAAATRSSNVSVTLQATGAVDYCATTSTRCNAFRSMTDTATVRLPRIEGEQVVRAWFRNDDGIRYGPYTSTILYDRTRPTSGVLHGSGGDGTIELSWSGFDDPLSGVEEYILMQAEGDRAPANCTRGTPAWTGPETDVVVSGLTNGQEYAFSVCARDAAGNLSRAVRTVVRAVPEQDPPVGSVEIVSSTGWTNERQVTLALEATDASGDIEMCVSSRTTCRAWEPFTAQRTETIRGSAGPVDVNVWFRDPWGNTSPMHTATIQIDRVAPRNGTLTAVPGIGSATLSWSGFSDSASGVASYAVYHDAGRRAPRCEGTPIWTGTDTTTTVTGLPVGSDASFRVCALDVAGNLSSGVTARVTPVPELDGPVGSLVLEGGGTWSRSRQVYLEPTATDVSAVTHVCLSDEDTCEDWVPLRPRIRWSLPNTEGVSTVNAWFRDEWGNVSEPVSADIGYDRTDPQTGSLSVIPGDGTATLSWSGFSDPLSGSLTYSVHHWRRATAPARCTGTPVWTGQGTSITLPGLDVGNNAFRVCATDAAGNQDDGATRTVVLVEQTAMSLIDPAYAVCSPDDPLAWLDELLLSTASSRLD